MPEEPRPEDEIEYEDEPAGAYLTQLRLGRGAVAWGLALILATLALALLGWRLGGRPVGPPEDPYGPLAPLELSWRFLPVIAALGFFISFFMRLNSLPSSPREAARGTLAVWLQLAALLLWLAARWVFHLGFLKNQ
ncbi:MAG: hypothetical protein HY717_08095 [Planctomycetes bacterium]|nr:hypothetical protein [Planctomycetota bacterium]